MCVYNSKRGMKIANMKFTLEFNPTPLMGFNKLLDTLQHPNLY